MFDRNPSPPAVPKLCGGDIELGNFILGHERKEDTGFEAARALLHEIAGFSPERPAPQSHQGPSASGAASDEHLRATSSSSQDWGRKWLSTNGGCAYIDLDHLELCLPEVLSAYDYVAAWQAMLGTAQAALLAANSKLPTGQRIQVLVNNSDGLGHAYGSHLNVLISRRAWENIFYPGPMCRLYLAAFQASSIVLAGQGKVGAENDAPAVPFQISQRADFFETLVGPQTTSHRPLVNSRDEPLCGTRRHWDTDMRGTDGMARLHCIFYDNTLSQVATLLKVGLMQIVLAMIEAEYVNPRCILEDAVGDVKRWSHDPSLQARARLLTGSEVTAVELQLLFLEEARTFVARGGCEGIVPQAENLLRLWEDTLVKLRAHSFATLGLRLDWVLKLSLLQRAMRQNPGLDWDSPEIKHLDHLYGSLDPEDGIYWAMQRSGALEQVVTADEIERLHSGPPQDTRAWTRAMLLRRANDAGYWVEDIDWDLMRFAQRRRKRWSFTPTLEMANPLAWTRAEKEHCFQRTESLDQLLEDLDAEVITTEGSIRARTNQDVFAGQDEGDHHETP